MIINKLSHQQVKFQLILMTFKINISEKSGNTYHLESDSEELMGKELHNKIEGKDISADLSGYEFEITGASDNAGFTAMENVEGTGLKKILLRYGKGMHKRPRREGKKKISNPRPKGLRLRKTVRGKIISPAIVQINLKILKEGNKKLSEIFPEQAQGKTKENRKIKRALVKKEKQEKPAEESKPQNNSKVEGDTGANAEQEGGAPVSKEEIKTEEKS